MIEPRPDAQPAAEPDLVERARLRRALGQFATGVAVVTARASDGRRVGITVNSFTSVSMDPPMVLWCIDKAAPSHADFRSATHAAVHILGATQHEIARRFAAPARDKFHGLATVDGFGGIPLIGEVVARFQCHIAHWYDGGDHSIVVGEVDGYDAMGGEPLVFHSGRYRVAASHPALGD